MIEPIKIERKDIKNTSDVPIFDHCRFLISIGVNPKTPLIVTRNGREDVYVRSIEEGSLLTVNGIYFEKYRSKH